MYINLILFRLNCQDFRRYFIDGKLGLNLYLKVSSIYFILIIKMHLTCEHHGTMYSQERLLFLRSLKETPNERLYHLLSWDKKHNSPIHTGGFYKESSSQATGVVFFIFPHRMNNKPVRRYLRGNHMIYCLKHSHLHWYYVI